MQKRDRIFLSHASENAAEAAKLCAELEAAGLWCWVSPRDVPPGCNYASAIVGAIRECRALVVLASAASLASPHVLTEVRMAFDGGRELFAFRLEDMPLNDEFQYYLGNRHWVNAWADLPGATAALRDALCTLTGAPVPGSAPGAVITVGEYPLPRGTYTGYLKNGLPHGRGIFRYKSGAVFMGTWQDDRFHGQGVYLYPDGTVLSGQWIDNRKEGEFFYRKADGSCVLYTYRADALISAQPLG